MDSWRGLIAVFQKDDFNMEGDTDDTQTGRSSSSFVYSVADFESPSPCRLLLDSEVEGQPVNNPSVSYHWGQSSNSA